MLSTEEKLVLNSMKLQPSEADRTRTQKLLDQVSDWKYLVELLTNRGLAPLFLHRTLSKEQVLQMPDSAKWVLQQMVFKTLSRNMVLYNAFSTLIKALDVQQIEVLALKGICLAEDLYRDIQLRQMSDIDILVKPEQGIQVIEALNKLGFVAVNTGALSDFVASKSDFVHYAPMVYNGISVEVHIRLHQSSDTVQIDLNQLWAQSEPVILNGVEARKMDLHHQLIYLCIHLHKHFKKGHVQFTSFADISNLIDIHHQEIDPKKLADLCSNYQCTNEVYPYLRLVNEFCNVELQEEIKNHPSAQITDVTRELFIRYLNGYTFEEPTNRSAVPEHIANLKKIRTIKEFVQYFKDLAFPSKAFMIDKYNIDSREKSVVGSLESSENQPTTNYRLKFWWLWYPYRWAVGVKGLLLTFKRRKTLKR